MASSDKFLLLDAKNGLPGKFVSSLLGRICDNPNRPWSNYFPESPPSFYTTSAEPFHIEAKSPSLIVDRVVESNARILLDELLQGERDKAFIQAADWRGELVRIFSLPQEKQVLNNILQEPENKSKAEEWLDDHESLYMITGFISVVNAACQVEDSTTLSTAFKASISKALEAAVLALSGVPVEMPSLAAEWHRKNEASTKWKATYADESIIAIRYRQLCRKRVLHSLLIRKEIRLGKRTNIPAAGDRMFGSGEDESEDIEEWEDIMNNGLDEAEEDLICLSPSTDVIFPAGEHTIIASVA